jgi:hypothetical protein
VIKFFDDDTFGYIMSQVYQEITITGTQTIPKLPDETCGFDESEMGFTLLDFQE